MIALRDGQQVSGKSVRLLDAADILSLTLSDHLIFIHVNFARLVGVIVERLEWLVIILCHLHLWCHLILRFVISHVPAQRQLVRAEVLALLHRRRNDVV